MSDLWVAVTCEHRGSTFSHRSVWPVASANTVVHAYNRGLDDAAGRVRLGLSSHLPVQATVSPGSQWSDYEKLAEIENLTTLHLSDEEKMVAINEVLKR